jgi:hypothetical protein
MLPGGDVLASRLVLLLVAVLLGCAGTLAAPSPETPDASDPGSSEFPAPEALYDLREQPLRPGSPFGTSYRDVASWDLVGPFPEVAETAPRPGGEPWDPLLDAVIRRRAGLVVATRGMECYAREAGRFLVEQRALPTLGVQRFLSSRCAVVTAPPSLATLAWESSRTFSVEEAVDELGERIAEALDRHVVGGPKDVGVWLHSGEGRVDLIIVQGRRAVRLDPVATVASADGLAVVSGEVLEPVAEAGAAVTAGRLGWQICQADAGVALPRFRFVCPLAAGDPTTWLSLHYVPPGHVLPRSGAQLLLRAPGVVASVYRRHAYAEARPVTRAEEVPTAFVELLNQVRAQAGAPPLTLATEQSRVAAEVAPYYLSAAFDPESEAVAELVALGMMAGWEIREIVQQGFFSFMWLVESRDVASLLSDALEFPGGRRMLLAQDLEQIAIGPVAGGEGETSYLALIAATYALFSEQQHRNNARHVIGSLARARYERGRGAPRVMDAAQPLAVAAAARVQAGGAPEDALGDLIQDGIDVLQRSVFGWLVETRDLDAIVFPDAFLDGEDLEVAIAVSSHRPEGEAWGRYVVLMLAAKPEQRRL